MTTAYGERMTELPQMTERQLKAWPGVLADANRFVGGGLPADTWAWMLAWKPEVRPGRSHDVTAIHTDGEHLVQIDMDVYGNGSVYVAALDRLHDSGDDECDCTPDTGLSCREAAEA